MYRLCSENGYMWIHQDIINGNGFFNFDLSFFEGMAAANGYGIVYNAFVVTTQDKQQHHKQLPISHVPNKQCLK